MQRSIRGTNALTSFLVAVFATAGVVAMFVPRQWWISLLAAPSVGLIVGYRHTLVHGVIAAGVVYVAILLLYGALVLLVLTPVGPGNAASSAGATPTAVPIQRPWLRVVQVRRG